MISLTDKILALHTGFDQAQIPHAFGGALALACCTARARGTVDIDCNVFLGSDQASRVVEALPAEVEWAESDVATLLRDGQTRLFWGPTTVDLFLNTTDFHEQASLRSNLQSFAGEDIPFLSCTDLTVFKSFFNRTKDWADMRKCWPSAPSTGNE